MIGSLDARQYELGRHLGQVGRPTADDRDRTDERVSLRQAHAEALYEAAELYEAFHEGRAPDVAPERAHLESASVLVAALTARDRYTGGHVVRVARYARALATELGWPDHRVHDLELGALLHDTGKLGVTDAILRKAGPLDDDEWSEMRRHPRIGAALLAGSVTLQPVLQTVLHHHERYDGQGYPTGLAGEEIPFEARIVAVVDAFDAMVSTRSYRTALPLSIALDELEQNAGTQFDPEIVPAFISLVRSAGPLASDV